MPLSQRKTLQVALKWFSKWLKTTARHSLLLRPWRGMCYLQSKVRWNPLRTSISRQSLTHSHIDKVTRQALVFAAPSDEVSGNIFFAIFQPCQYYASAKCFVSLLINFVELGFSESVILLFNPTMNNLSVLCYSSIENRISPDQIQWY